ncbi:4Fe-4S binding protein [Geomonas sp. RF6]|uniref:4Fe-4S binding protein n=1 Tax=Geomonas sp. RF6 TaxID=2897342 RepID=UPI001E29CDDE|nr:4Fe-4S binding protein [Geomonas sp. RF6]UFS70412.1 4Fe-4S binding protein [Geomonas sp. RF6]
MFMLTTILKNFFTGSATRLYPFKTREPFEDVKGTLKIDIEKCTFCTVCQIKCPSQCIQVDRKEKTWKCDPFSCVYCGICVDVCPTDSLVQDTQYREAVFNKSADSFAQPAKPAAAETPDEGTKSV